MSIIYFISRLDQRTASYRFRVHKIIPFLIAKGNEVIVECLKPKYELISFMKVLICMIRRKEEKKIIVFQKAVLPFFAKLCRFAGAVIVFDFDDAPHSRIDGSMANRKIINNFKKLINTVNWVVTGSSALDNWVSQFGTKHVVIPTCVDTRSYEKIHPVERGKVVVGWIGSGPVEVYFGNAINALLRLVKEDLCNVLIIGDKRPATFCHPNIIFSEWDLGMEPEVFHAIDIGIMPLPDNERGRMKAGFKLLQYMAASLPVVASPVGINVELIGNNERGYLASTAEEWYILIKELIQKPKLRRNMGILGKNYVKKNYDTSIAVDAWNKLLGLL